ncbi:phosphonate metabolism protein/1,5-bisphosphokinase (PRPP-forming) PhnN [Paracoccus albus]|uniref:phosphonate metabolism protein/1,5-bisphosphokinase (PRPP-forming) PhnN n=1 Tax=Paracoccus albus TaxID=3017784 RepID=UPI0022F0ED7E|nr:phosphonate metabolism protein/1,5-bisphosphokinase (PRPP-forming) PhnN [Paracoccus albus]WBU61640.1 phosphonate metabolism protein/1,5-bisphosphokinase (PRPP-forming) PhnN [Paracoccus albus]
MSLRYIAVVGPSGAGKDTLMRAACDSLPGISQVRRVITRASADQSEEFEPVSEAEFARREERDAFVLKWQAHGLRYGIPRETGSGLRLVNLSRRILRQAAMVLPELSIVHVTASPDVLSARLSERGRETAHEIPARINREAEFDPAGLTVINIDNSGDLSASKSAFTSAVQELSK